MFPNLTGTIKPQNEKFEVFEVNMVCPNRTLGLQIDGKRPPFSVNPVKPPATETEIKPGNTLVGIDDWEFSAKTTVNEVLKSIRKVMASEQPVIKLVLQREKTEKDEHPQFDGQTWTCQRCTIVNTMSGSVCNTCGLTKAESMNRLKGTMQTDWICSSCTYENPSDKQNCVMCETARISGSQQQNEWMTGQRSQQLSSADEMKKASEMSVARGPNAYQPRPNALEFMYGTSVFKPQIPKQPPMHLQYNQYNQPQYQQPQKQLYMGNWIPNAQGIMGVANDHPRNARSAQVTQPEPKAPGYMEDSMAQVKEPLSVERDLIPERESIKKLSSWKCQLCTTTNDADGVKCTTCRAPRLSVCQIKAEPEFKQQTAATNSTHQRKGRWKCPNCQYENSASAEECLMCSRSLPEQGNYEVVTDPKEALETLDREKIAMAWLQKQLIVENRCRVTEFDAAFRRSNNRVTEAIFRLTSGFQNLDSFKEKLERFVGAQVTLLKRMGNQMDGRLQTVDSELQKVATRYQETTNFLNQTQQEVDDKTYLKKLADKLESLNGQEKELLHHLEELKAEKDNVTLKMRSEQINKKLQADNCERVVKQLQLQLASLKTEKNDLGVQEQIIRQQVSSYEEMKLSLENVKLNDLKSTVKIFQSMPELANTSQQSKSTTEPMDLMDLRRMSNTASRKSRQESPRVLSGHSSGQTTPDHEGETQPHQAEENEPEAEFFDFFTGSGGIPQSSVPKDEDENSKECNDEMSHS